MGKLKIGQIYMYKNAAGWNHDLGVIRRSRCIFGDRRKWNWEMEFPLSIYPEEMNSGFFKDIKENYELIGGL